MSKFDPLWKAVAATQKDHFTMTFPEIECAAGVPIDHSFLTYKKELLSYGYMVGKISMKAQTVEFRKLQ